MRKLLKSIACFATAALVGASAFANYGWYQTSIDIGGIRSDYSTWSPGGQTPDTDLGTLSSLTVSGVQMKVWDDSNDRGGANMYFRLYDDNGQVGGDVDLWLGDATRIEGDHDFSISYSGTFDLAGAFGVTLEEGKPYYLNMWAKTYKNGGSEYDNHWYNGSGDNFHTKFVYAAPKTYTLVENADDFVVGADYLIVSTVDGASSAMKNEANGTAIGCLGLANDAIAGNVISSASDAIVWQVKSGTVLGQRVWYNAVAGKYAAAPDSDSSGAQLLDDYTDAIAQWTIDFSALPAVKIYNASYTDRYLQRDASAANACFAAYDNAQATPRLYRADSTEVQTVTFDPNGGTYMEDKLVMKYAIGREYWGIWTPRWEGHKFLGWYDVETGDKIWNNMEVTSVSTREVRARWAAWQTVTFDANGGTCSKESVECANIYTGFVTPTRAGYKFLGWYDALEGGTKIWNGTKVSGGSTLTVHARWAAWQTVTFDANGGTCSKESVECANIYTGFVTPTRAGYKFLGWYDALEGGSKIWNGTKVSGGATLTVHARWAAWQTVTFDANGGTCSKESVECANIYTGFVTPTRDGYKFLGWYDALEGGTKIWNGTKVSGGATLTVHARWKVLAISSMRMKSAGISARDARSAGEQAVELSLETVAGSVYEVQWAASLDGEWTVLKSWVAEVDGETSVTVTIPADAASGFFRLSSPDGE